MSDKVKGAIVFIAGIVVSVGSSYLYKLTRIYFELDIPSLTEKLIVFMAPLFIAGSYSYGKIKKSK